MQRKETQRDEANQEELSYSVLVPCGYDGPMPNEVDRRRDGTKPPSRFVSPYGREEKNQKTPSTHARQGRVRPRYGG